MKKSLQFLVILFIAIFSFNSAKSQYTMLTDFFGNGAPQGKGPQFDQNVISDGTYLYGMTSSGGSNNMGTAFKIKISDNTYTKILDFTGTVNGSIPYGSFISDGTYLYGMTSQGGANNVGTVFKLKISDNTLTKLLDFAGTDKGSSPFGSLFSDDTYLYGTTSQGGTNNSGTVFKLKISDNTFTKMFDFDDVINGRNPQGSLISDGSFLYGMTSAGGANNKGTLFKIKISDNTYTKLFDFSGTASGSNPHGSLISDGTYLYGMTSSGGLNFFGTVFKIKISDNTYSKLLDFGGSNNGREPYGTLISDGTYLYGMTKYGGTNNRGNAFKIKISDNTYTSILDFNLNSIGSNPLGSFISDGNYLFGMAYKGGGYNGNANSLGTVFKIKINDNSCSLLMDFIGNANQCVPNGSLVTDGNYLFGMTRFGVAYGNAYKIRISDNTYTNMLGFSLDMGVLPNGSFISDGIYLYGMTTSGGTNTQGTLFKIKISDNTYTKLLNFTGIVNGSNGNGSLISDGIYLYGMTMGGGINSDGTIFKLKISDNTYTKLLDFDGLVNGSEPNGSLISDGTFLYGMTRNGGTNNLGTVFKLKISDNTFSKLLDFNNYGNGCNPYGSLISDGTYLYGMTANGGANYYGTAFKIKISDNSYTKLFDFDCTANGSEPHGSLISDGTYLYGMTYLGGTNNLGTLFKIKISDNTFTKLMDFSGINNGRNPYSSLIFNGSFLYGTTSGGGFKDLGTVFKYQIYYPEISVKQNGINISNNTGFFDFGRINAGTSQTQTFTIENTGIDMLHLTGTSKVMVSGTGFSLAADAPIDVNAGGIATCQVTFTPDAVGVFNGTISIENDAVGDSPYIITVKGTGIPTNGFVELSENNVTAYPNPASGSLTISGLSAFKGSENIQVFVVDILGQTKLTKTFENRINKGTIDISSLTNGTYFIHLQTDTEKIVKQIFKQ